MPVATWNDPSRSSQRRAERHERRLDRGRIEVAGDDRANGAACRSSPTRAGRTWRPSGSRRSRARNRPRASRPGRARAGPGARRSAASRGRSSPTSPALDGDRPVPAAVRAEERVARGVEAGRPVGAGEVGEMVASLAVLGLVVDDAVLDLDLADRVVALEVRRVVLRVPQAELDRAEQRQAGRRRPLVRHARPPDLEGLAERHEVARLRPDPGAARGDGRVAHPVAALVVVELALGRLPAGAPVRAVVVVAEVQVAPAEVERCVVVAVARQPPQPRVPVERVAAGGVRDDPEVVLAAEVVDPGQRRVGSGDDVFASVVVEVSHSAPTSRRP